MSIKSAAAVTLLTVLGVQANIFITEPIGTTSCTGGQVCNIAWKDDGNAPLSSQFGDTTVGLYVGSAQSQTLVQLFGNLDPAVTIDTNPTITPSVGPNGNFYFIRFQSVAAVDANNNPLVAFSAKFTLTGMTGTLTPAESSQISGSSSIGGSMPSIVANSTSTTSGSARQSTSTSSSSSSSASSTAKGNSSSSNSTSSSNTAKGAASNSKSIGFGAIAGVVGTLSWFLA